MPLNEVPPDVYRIDLAAAKAAQIVVLPPGRRSNRASLWYEPER